MESIYDILAELRPENDFHASTDFIGDGMLDSFDIVELVTALEEKFDILIDALDILPENFANTDAIAGVVRKNGGSL
ncbi:MAG: acyl carrier protein [Clostridia bacterium]|nr:acyl carrier protein [Clostridia bacterium]